MQYRLPTAREKRPPSPKHDGRGQSQLHPALSAHVHQVQPFTEHGQHEDNGRQWQGPPEAALKVTQLGVFIVLQSRHDRLQCHATFRAVAGVILTHFGVHRTGVDRSSERWHRFGMGWWCIRGGSHVLHGIGVKFCLALGATKEKATPHVIGVVLRLRCDGHSTHRVFQDGGISG